MLRKYFFLYYIDLMEYPEILAILRVVKVTSYYYNLNNTAKI